ncbi:hypothetical protein PoB_000076000 [Plakobranchus ocellatus]|uniref:Uncharacterized protein n=1 Tax=Plakobranchus ocellatus TaxID=259542 RepID=A0AAV3XTN4_9GAST|nr:hypothetical protein PoB_000076000 [Plakobranchus ocellatus]
MNQSCIIAVCLALFIQTAFAQNDTLADSSNNSTAANSSSSSSSSSSSNSTAAENNSSNSSNMSGSTGQQFTPGLPTDFPGQGASNSTPSLPFPPSAPSQPGDAVAGNNTAGSNDTSNGNTTASLSSSASNATSGNDSSASNATEGGSSEASDTSTSGSTDVSFANLTLFGISDKCAERVRACLTNDTTATAYFEELNYCSAFEKTQYCVEEHDIPDINMKNCTQVETQRLLIFSCGPDTLHVKAGYQCKARITHCSIDALSDEEMSMDATDELFKNVTCSLPDSAESVVCLTSSEEGAVCSTQDIQILNDETCAAMNLLSSLFLTLVMLLVARAL